MGFDLWGGNYAQLIQRLLMLRDLKKDGVSRVSVEYVPSYFLRYAGNPHLLDPLHMDFVIAYAKS